MNFREFMDSMLGNNKKLMNVFIALVVGILLLVLGGGMFGQNKAPPKNIKEDGFDVVCLERRLEGILSQIQGAGSVSVMIMTDDSGEKIIASDTKNTGGSSTSDEKKTVVYDGGKQPLIVKTVSPNVKGVIVVAQGASDEYVKESIEKAVVAILPVLPHRVEVFVKKK